MGKTTYAANTAATWKWTVAGSYQVKLTVTDNDGLKTSILISVTVRQRTGVESSR